MQTYLMLLKLSSFYLFSNYLIYISFHVSVYTGSYCFQQLIVNVSKMPHQPQSKSIFTLQSTVIVYWGSERFQNAGDLHFVLCVTASYVDSTEAAVCLCTHANRFLCRDNITHTTKPVSLIGHQVC